MASRQPRYEHDPAFPDEPEFGPVDDDDTSLFLPRHGEKTTGLNWREADNGGPLTLSENDVEELYATRCFTRRALSDLRGRISNLFHEYAFVCPVEVKRSVALERAQKHIGTAIDRARRGNVVESLELIAPLSDEFGSEKSYSKALARAKRLGAGDRPDAKAYLAALIKLQNIPGAAFDLSPLDRRKIWDDYRKHVVWECCRTEGDCGRKVTYIRLDDGSLGGPTIDFIQDVIGRLTVNGVAPSPETIRRDIDLFKKSDPTVYCGEDLETFDPK